MTRPLVVQTPENSQLMLLINNSSQGTNGLDRQRNGACPFVQGVYLQTSYSASRSLVQVNTTVLRGIPKIERGPVLRVDAPYPRSPRFARFTFIKASTAATEPMVRVAPLSSTHSLRRNAGSQGFILYLCCLLSETYKGRMLRSLRRGGCVGKASCASFSAAPMSSTPSWLIPAASRLELILRPLNSELLVAKVALKRCLDVLPLVGVEVGVMQQVPSLDGIGAAQADQEHDSLVPACPSRIQLQPQPAIAPLDVRPGWSSPQPRPLRQKEYLRSSCNCGGDARQAWPEALLHDCFPSLFSGPVGLEVDLVLSGEEGKFKGKGKGKGKGDAHGRRPRSQIDQGPPNLLVFKLALLRLLMSMMIGSHLLCESGRTSVAGITSRHWAPSLHSE